MSDTVFGRLRRIVPISIVRKLPRKVKLVDIGGAKANFLKHKFFGGKRSANVLSFRYGPDYGEILVCPAVIRKEAKKQGNTYEYQMTWMILHGMLHLAGMHHESSRQAARNIFKLEQRVLLRMFKNAGNRIKVKR